MRTETWPTAAAIRREVKGLVAVPDAAALTKQLPGLQQDLLAGDLAGVARRLANIDGGKEVWDRKLAVARYTERSQALFERFGLQPAQLAAVFGARLGELAEYSPHQVDFGQLDQLRGLNANGLLSELGRLLPVVHLEDFIALVALAQERLRDPAAKEPDGVFQKNLSWLATSLITEGRRYKDPSRISDDDLAKLEALRKLHGFDYAKELMVPFNTTVVDGPKRNEVAFEKPLWLYLADAAHDLTPLQVQLIIEGIEREVPRDAALTFYRWTGPYVPELMIRATQPSEHLDSKNLLHVLMERPLTPNKQRLAEFLFERGAGNSSFKVFARDESWNAPNSGRYNRSWWYGSCSVLGSAVASESPQNVRLALEHGSKLSKAGDGLGNEFADAARRPSTPATREIVELLMLAAEKAGTLELLNQPYRDAAGSVYPIEYFARAGDLDKVLKLAASGAGVPIEQVQSATLRFDGIPLGDTHSPDGTPLYPPTTSRTKTEYWFVEVGKESLAYIKQAAFNVYGDGRYYRRSDQVFDRAVDWLQSQRVLAKDEVPGPQDPRFLNFVRALRAAALEEYAKNERFLFNAAAFTPGFAEAVARIKNQTDNFASPPPPPSA